MRKLTGSDILIRAYLVLFFFFLLAPLGVMVIATFNSSRFPTVTPWLGTTTKWFDALFNDPQMWEGLVNSLIVGVAVVLVSVPLGTAAAMVLDNLHRQARTFVYAVMVSPLLTPGVIIGISTLVFWDRLGVKGGLHLAVIGQSSFITAYIMLMVLARLQRLDRSQEEAALDLGASHPQVFRKILLPYLRSSLVAGGVLAFFQSFENYNTTLFTRGTDITLTIYIASKVRTGLTPAVNALGVILIALTIVGAVGYEIMRRREVARAAAARRQAELEEIPANALVIADAH
ncbi:ABC transporter permease [Ancylobacter amanitiformis]|uniref:Spermidine/putrescine transport system permease protein n=1 Tax=Ancylobacter amanitiformis TaxID=217069 RepID=A0ABU0LPB7_9HYPH|nr:ABC transporter permease [Ancylobacter amanitiformis]MDQ0510547.1 spermidine/putrescine transport system permease protein [Ancylobacter amanitiformis]